MNDAADLRRQILHFGAICAEKEQRLYACVMSRGPQITIECLYAEVQSLTQYLVALQAKYDKAQRIEDLKRSAERAKRQAAIERKREAAAQKRAATNRQREAERQQRRESLEQARQERDSDFPVIKPIVVQTPRWHNWKPSAIEDVAPVIAVQETDDEPTAGDHSLSDEIRRRGDGLLNWSPWARRERYAARSRWYEGFFDPYRRVP